MKTIAALTGVLAILGGCADDDEPPAMTPSFTFRTMDHLKASVFINGERYSDSTCLWSISAQTKFDPKIEVPEWPPKGAAWVGSQTRKEDPPASVEIAIEGGRYDSAGRERLRKACPHLEAGEQVLYVSAEVGGAKRRGAFRLKMVGGDGAFYRYVDFNPVNSDEDERAALFARSVWFERENKD